MWIPGFGTLGMLGDLVTPEYLLLKAGQATDQSAGREDAIGSWLPYFVNGSKKEILL